MRCPACEGSGFADYAAVPCELCEGSKVDPNPPKPLAYRWPWSRYKNFGSWLWHGLIIYWRCVDCGKRHLSTPKGWSKHIGYDVPLCTACEDAVDRSYDEWIASNEPC